MNSSPVAALPQHSFAGLPRVGHISFLNCLPLYWGLHRTGGTAQMDLVQDTPDRLSDALVAGKLDAGPISLVEYLRNPDELLVLPDLAVGSDGPVMSVVLVSKVPLTDLDGRVVALGSTSRTSVVLAKLLLEEHFRVHPRYETREPDLRTMMRHSDAAVLIGDPALRATFGDAAELGLTVYDLGAGWREWTGLPMVFAVWAVRRAWADRDPAGVDAVHSALLASRDLSLDHVDEVAAEVAEWEPFESAQLSRYFRSLEFSLDERQQEGIAEFRKLAASRVTISPYDTMHFLHH